MAESSPPKSSDPGAKPSEPPSDSAPEIEASDEGNEASDPEVEEADQDEKSVDSLPSVDSGGRISLVEMDLDPDPSVPGPKMPSKPPPAPTKRGSSPPPDDGRRLPEPAFMSQVPKPPPGQSMVPPRKFPPETVGDVMTRKLIALTENDTVENIETGMQRFRFRHLPVVTKDNKLIGLVTQRDMSKAEAKASAASEDGNGGLPKSTPVSEVMNRDILTTKSDTDLVTAGKAMLQKKIGCLPIILDDETLVGIITEADFVKLVVQLLDHDKDKD